MNTELKTMMQATSIFFADDHFKFLSEMCSFMKRRSDTSIIGTAAEGHAAFKQIVLLKPDIAFLDINMPGMDGFQVARELAANNIATQIVFITLYNEEAMVRSAFELGCRGYILKENAFMEINPCIKTVVEGGLYISPQISDYLTRIQASGLLQPKPLPNTRDLG